MIVLSCSNGEDVDSLASPPTVTPTLENRVIDNLLGLYRTAIEQEDIDRLQELFQPAGGTLQVASRRAQTIPIQTTAAVSFDTETFIETLSNLFRTRAITDVQLEDIVIADDRRSVTFLEIQSYAELATLTQWTRVLRTTLQLTLDVEEAPTLHIIAVQQEGPIAQVATRGQIISGAPTRVEVWVAQEISAIDTVEIIVPESGTVQTLTAAEERFQGIFIPPEQTAPEPLRVRIRRRGVEAVMFAHPYRHRMVGEGVVQKIAGTGTASFAALAVAPDGSVVAGGREPPRGGSTLYEVPPGTARAHLIGDLLPEDAESQVEDLVFDRLGRLQSILLAAGSEGVSPNNQVVVRNGNVFCATVNAFDPEQSYPLQVKEPQSGDLVTSPSTRLFAAGDGNVWLFGSDGGVVLAEASVQVEGEACATVTVRYTSLFTRDNSDLLTNSVPAFVAGADGTLWFGTALGVMRLREGRLTPVLFDHDLTVQGDAATLERFLRAVAEAIHNARPLTSVAIGEVSFVAEFGRPLVKEDLIFSMLEDGHGRLWVGTLGGGIRRIEGDTQTLHLTRQDGLVSNIVFALAVGPDGAIWAATEEGVSRIQATEGGVAVTNFSALDGLALPVRDVAVDPEGTAWLATDEGLFRIIPRGGQSRGVVRRADGLPVMGADVVVLDTPYRAVTDIDGRFVLRNLPPGQYRVQIDGSLAQGGPFRSAFRDIVVAVEGASEAGDINTTLRGDANHLLLLEVSGNRQSGQPGEVLTEPLVVRLQDQFGNPVVGEDVTAQIIEGEGELVSIGDAQISLGSSHVEQTNASGEAQFFLRVGNNETDRVETRVTAVSTPDQEVAFLTLVGFSIPLTLAAEPDGNLVVVDTGLDAVLRVDPQTGVRSLVSGRGRGSGAAFEAPWGIDVLADGALAVADNFLNAVLRVDLDSGDRTVLSGCADTACRVTIGNGPPLEGPQDIAVLTDGSVVVVDNFVNAVLRVDPGSGERTLLSGCTDVACTDTVGDGPLFLSPGAIAAETSGTLVMVDYVLDAVLRIDPTTGDRTIVSGCLDVANCTVTMGSGPPFLFPWSIAVETDGDLVVVDNLLNALVRVDASTGKRTIVSGCIDRVDCPDTVGSGPLFLSLRGIAVETGGALVMVDDGLDAVLRVDPGSGDRTVVSRASRGDGSPFGTPVGVAVEADGQLVIVDSLRAVVLRVDPDSGDRSLVSGCFDNACPDSIGSGPDFVNPQAVAVEPGGTLVVVDSGRDAVLRVDPSNGNRFLLSDAMTGSGLSFMTPRDIAIEPDGNLVVVDTLLAAIIRVDPVTGDRTLISGRGRGSGPPIPILAGITVKPDGVLLVVDSGFDAVFQVDPTTGDRRVVSGPGIGKGPSLIFPEDLVIAADGTFFVVGSGLDAVVRVDPFTGDRSLLSDAQTGSGLPFVNPRALAIAADGDLVVVDPLLAAAIGVDPTTGDRTTLSRLSVIPARAFAKVAAGDVIARPIADFIDAQGSLCIPDGMGGCFLVVPPIENFIAWTDPLLNRCVSVDYAGLANATVEAISGGSISFGTEMDGFVLERPLADGRAKVTVLLTTKNALTWVNEGCENYVADPLLFGNRVSHVVDEGGEPTLGTSTMVLVFINPAPGLDLPDLVQLAFFPAAGQEWSFVSFRARADGELRGTFGVTDGTPGRTTIKQLSIFIPPFFEGFPVESIDLRVLEE